MESGVQADEKSAMDFLDMKGSELETAIENGDA